MKIVNVEVYQLASPAGPGSATWAGNSILLRLTTSNGLVGYGEAVPTLRVRPVLQSLRQVERVYKGSNPLNVERNMHEWHKHDFYLPMSFESTTAVSAFDIACWDIIGKHFGAPVHQLVGGSFRKRVRAYLNGWYDGCVKPEQFRRKARSFARRGYTGLKFDPFGNYYDYIDEKGLKAACDRVKAVREGAGPRVDIMIEHHGRFNPNSAIMIARRLREFDPLFMEEPIHPENLEGMRKYRAATDVRVAVGERILTKEDALRILSNNLTDFLQADLTNIGGFTQARKVCAIAEAYGVEMALHNAFGPIQNAATVQLDAAIPNFLIQESFFDVFPPWKRELVRNQPKLEGGYINVPTREGIGVEIDERVLEACRAEGQEHFDPEEPVWVVKDTWKR